MTALIAGAGIAGLTLALALARRGVTSSVFERAEKLEETGAGVQLSPNASRVLDALGLGPALDAVATRPEAAEIFDAPTGRSLKRLPLGSFAERRWGAPYRVVHRADLQAALLKAVRATGRVEIALGLEIRDVSVTDADVALEFSYEPMVTGEWLAGCDGLHSITRRAVALPTEASNSGLKAWRTTVPASAAPSSLDLRNVSVWLGPGAHMVVYPIRQGRQVNVVLIGDARAAGPQTLSSGWAQGARALVAAGGEWTEWPLRDRAPDARLQRGRVALLGDAAHAALPSLAQGAGFAIEDAAVLARLVAEHGPTALPAYQDARLMRVARMQANARRQMRIDHLAGLAATARNAALTIAPTAALTGGLDWIYGWRDAG